jgi:RimJ/RimL family protein N-acetyltransferase
MSLDVISREHYLQIAPLFSELRFNLVVDSILDGNTSAWVFANLGDASDVALMWNRMDAVLLGVRQTSIDDINSLREVLHEVIIPEARKTGIPEFTLFFDFQNHYHLATALVENLNFHAAKRRFYHFKKPKNNLHSLITVDAELHKMTAEMFSGQKDRNEQRVLGWILSFWESVDAFLERGFGFYVVHNHQIASWCLSVYTSGNHYELGLETAGNFRQKGFATAVAVAAVKYCDEAGFVPHWHCWNDNLGSIAVAQKVGFFRPMGYRVFRISL